MTDSRVFRKGCRVWAFWKGLLCLGVLEGVVVLGRFGRVVVLGAFWKGLLCLGRFGRVVVVGRFGRVVVLGAFWKGCCAWGVLIGPAVPVVCTE